jgi:hypothetical protein
LEIDSKAQPIFDNAVFITASTPSTPTNHSNTTIPCVFTGYTTQTNKFSTTPATTSSKAKPLQRTILPTMNTQPPQPSTLPIIEISQRSPNTHHPKNGTMVIRHVSRLHPPSNRRIQHQPLKRNVPGHPFPQRRHQSINCTTLHLNLPFCVYSSAQPPKTSPHSWATHLPFDKVHHGVKPVQQE